MINQHGKTAEVTIGDIHGNTMKFIYFLIREGVLELSPPKDAITIFKKLTDIYNGPQPPTPEDLKYFEQSLERMKVLTNAPKVRLIGDELADRGKNDLLTLLVMEKLQNAGKPPEIIFSNHSLGFMKVYEEHMIKGFNGPINSGINVADTNSLKGMFDTLEQYPEMKNRVLDIVKNAYLPHLKIMSYSANPSNQGMAPYSHAPVGLEAVDKLKEKYSPNCQDYKNNSVALTDCIDKINRLFRQSILSAGFFSEVTTNPNDAVRYVVWNRNYEGLERPEVLKDGTRMSYIHGHDSREKNDSKSPSHVICLDNTLGKGKRSSNIGEYSIYATGSNKTSQAVNFPNHQLSSLGFINLGNTCFANAAHNSILAHPALDTYLAATSHDYSSVVPPAQFNTPEQQAQWHLTKAFRDLALDYRKAQSQKVNTGNFEPQLKNLFSRLKAYLRITSPESEFINGIPGEQMDSEEYFTLLTDKVGLSRYLSPLRIASQIEFTGSGGVKNKPKQDPAGNAIQAPINGASTVAEALQNYLSPEILDKSEWVNHPKTGQPAPSQKTSYLTVGQDGKFPDHLTINLKRFESEVKVKNGQATVETKKLKNRVKITEKLDVPYYDGSLKQYACKRMVPSSVVVHTGNTAHSGHYYAYVYHAKDNTWFERNDSVVKKLNPLEVQTAKNVMSENAYYMTYVTDPSGSKCSK
jgi:ubiquitin C-terminal hydrolase